MICDDGGGPGCHSHWTPDPAPVTYSRPVDEWAQHGRELPPGWRVAIVAGWALLLAVWGAVIWLGVG